MAAQTNKLIPHLTFVLLADAMQSNRFKKKIPGANYISSLFRVKPSAVTINPGILANKNGEILICNKPMAVRKQAIKIFSSRALKKTFGLVILFLAFTNSLVLAQSYYTGQAPDAPGSYKKTAHTIYQLTGKEKTMAIQMMDAMVDAVRNVYPQPIGAEIGPYGGIWQNYRGISESYVTFDASTIMDWGLLFETEIDLKGVGKPFELKQTVTLSINKGLTAEGPITDALNKLLDIPPMPPEKQVNKNVKIYNPQ